MKKHYQVWRYPNSGTLKKIVLVTESEDKADDMVMNLEAKGIPAKYKTIK